MGSTKMLAGVAILFMGAGCLDPAYSSGGDTGGGDNPNETSWTLTQRMPSGGVGLVSVGDANSSEQIRVMSSPGHAQLLQGVSDPHTRHSSKRSTLDMLANYQADLVHAPGVPGNP